MKNDFTGIIKTEENGSRAVEWPFMHRIINYRWDFDGTKTGYIQMIGNPINWGLALVGTLAAMGLSVRRRLFRDTKLEGTDIARLEGLLCMYLLYWGFHIWLGTQRVMYIYHYFIALCLAYFMTALAFKVIMTRYAHLFKWRLYAQLTIAVSIAIGFIFYAPLTYHQKLSRQECELRNIPFKAVVCQPKLKKPL
jgi:dolichyl-phosphate-mannose--protein O-mannosyl transferase